MNQELITLLKAMEKDEAKAPYDYQKIINLLPTKSDKKLLLASQSDEKKHHAKIVKLLKKYSK